MDAINRFGTLCQGKITVQLPYLNPKGPSRLGDTNGMAGKTSLAVVPNPVKDMVALSFDYGSADLRDRPSLTVYDLLGRPMDHYIPKNSKDSWQLDMSRYGAGIYIVVMKLNGQIVEQKNIVLNP